MRKITEIIIHCSDTFKGSDFKAEDIDAWHKAKGFKGIGYHFVIDLDGTIEEGRPIEEQGAHCLWHNKNSIGICYIGGRHNRSKPYERGDTRTAAQVAAMHQLVSLLLYKYPSITKVVGHNTYAARMCPCFMVEPEFEYMLK